MTSNDKKQPINLVDALSAQRTAFKAFITSRVGSASDAEDILQINLAKAVQRSLEIHDGQKIVTWFYQILRHAIIDHYRTQGAVRRRDAAVKTLVTSLEQDTTIPSSWEPQLCVCLGGIITSLPTPNSELVQRVDLEGESVQVVAEQLGLTANHASVILHRTRKTLRTKLENFCGLCATEEACRDCDCDDRNS